MVTFLSGVACARSVRFGCLGNTNQQQKHASPNTEHEPHCWQHVTCKAFLHRGLQHDGYFLFKTEASCCVCTFRSTWTSSWSAFWLANKKFLGAFMTRSLTTESCFGPQCGEPNISPTVPNFWPWWHKDIITSFVQQRFGPVLFLLVSRWRGV